MSNSRPASPPLSAKGTSLQSLYPLSGNQLIARILKEPDPQKAVRHMAGDDFYWLLKQLDQDENAVLLLELASEQQWQYVLDLELWEADRLNMPRTFEWLHKLQQAAPERLTRWLFSDGQSLAFYSLFKGIVVKIQDPDDPLDLEDGFITFDGVYYIQVRQGEYKRTIEGILKTMAHTDQLRYQALLLGLAGVLPAELEEEMYRMKNVRLAEHGFLPLEEALPIYAPLDPEALKRDGDSKPGMPPEEEVFDLSPYMPFYAAMGKNLLTRAIRRITEPREQDRMRLEFAGLCNQVLSADQQLAADADTLKQTCRKAGGYVNLTLEKLCHEDASAAEALLRANPLRHLFRVGFGLALKLKWEAERWLRENWFLENHMGYGFWPDDWAGTLTGLVKEKPLVFAPEKADEPYRDFEYAQDLEHARNVLHRMIALDRLFLQLTGSYPLPTANETSQFKYDQLLLTFWARALLDQKPAFAPVSASQMDRLFELLRQNEAGPPFEMPGYEAVFVRDFTAYVSDQSSEIQSALEDALTRLWEAFQEEYRWVPTEALDSRFCSYLLVR